MKLTSRLRWVLPILFLFLSASSSADDTLECPDQKFTLQGELGQAEKMSIDRYFSEPFTDIPWMRADISLERKRIFTNYSGDVSGRFLEVMAVLSHGDTKYHPAIEPLIEAAIELQRPDGHFGDPAIDWDGPVDMNVSFQSSKVLPALWGNGRIFCGLIEMYKATGDKRLLEAAEKLGDFYIHICKRFTDPKRISEFTGFKEEEIKEHLEKCQDKQLTLLPATGDTHAGGYVTCFFPGMEGLTKLYIVTKNKKYLETAERMAGFYRLFDVPDTTHVHGMLCCHYAFLLLYQETGNKDYLDRVVERWETLTANGVVSAIGGTPEAARLQFGQDEGCALADWLRVNVKLFEITRNPRYLEAAERLIHNHYLMNEWSDGGFGHRTLLYDRAGTYGLGLHRLECVWCCNYHGTMGFDYFKKSLAFLEPDGLHLQFAVDFEASLIDHGRKVDLRSQVRYNSPSTKAKDTVELPKGIVLSQELEFRGGNVKNGMLSVRIPDWADSVTLRTADGNTIETGKTGKYVKTQENISFEQPVIVDYHGGVFVENRMGKRINPQADEKGRFGPLVFRYGPKVLVAEGIQNIPMIKIPSDGGRFPELDPTKLTFDCSVPVKINVHSLELVPFGYGTEKNTAVFVFETTCGELEHYAVDQLVSRKTGKPVKVADERPFDSGTPIVMAEDRNAENRNDEATHWLIEEVGDGFYRFLNCKTGKLLSESGEGAAVDGRKVHQWEDVSNPAQLWKKVDLDGRFVRFVNKSSGRALNLDASGKTNVWSVKDDESQQWSIQKIDGTIVPLRQESPPQ